MCTLCMRFIISKCVGVQKVGMKMCNVTFIIIIADAGCHSSAQLPVPCCSNKHLTRHLVLCDSTGKVAYYFFLSFLRLIDAWSTKNQASGGFQEPGTTSSQIYPDHGQQHLLQSKLKINNGPTNKNEEQIFIVKLLTIYFYSKITSSISQSKFTSNTCLY